MAIYKAILKYGYSEFSLEILEYCDPDKVLDREQYYVDLLNPEYNILKTAGSSRGYKHTEETLAKFKLRVFTGEARANLSASATGRVLSDEAKAKISAARSGIKLSAETRAKLSAATTAIHGVAVEVINVKTDVTKQFSTMTEAGLALGVSRTTIKKAIQSGKVFRKDYIIKINKK